MSQPDQPLNIPAINANARNYPAPAQTDIKRLIREIELMRLRDHRRITALQVEKERDQLLARVRQLEAELATSEAVAASNQNAARLLAADVKRLTAEAAADPATCESCGHLESAHDPNGDRDCHASGARIRQCTCAYFIPCYPEPAA